MATTRSPAPRDVLYTLAFADNLNADLLDDLVKLHPDHAADLTEFAIELAIDRLRSDDVVLPPSAGMERGEAATAVSRAISRFHNKLHAIRQAPAGIVAPGASAIPPRDAANPFGALDRRAFGELAARLGGNAVFAIKLRDRAILPDTMSDGFRRHVAAELKAPLDIVIAHLASAPVGATRQFYKADDKPTVQARQTFAEAVAGSGLTPAQQAFLLSL